MEGDWSESVDSPMAWRLIVRVSVVTIFLQLTNFFILSRVYMRGEEWEGGQDPRPDNESSGCDTPWNTPPGPRRSIRLTTRPARRRPGENRNKLCQQNTKQWNRAKCSYFFLREIVLFLCLTESDNFNMKIFQENFLLLSSLNVSLYYGALSSLKKFHLNLSMFGKNDESSS